MPSIEEVYKYYLKAADLQGQPRTVQIEKAAREETFDPKAKRNKPCIELTFRNKLKVMALNKTQAAELAQIVGTPDYTQWAKAVIILTPTEYRGKDTITITAAPVDVGKPAPSAPAPARRDPEKIIKELYSE